MRSSNWDMGKFFYFQAKLKPVLTFLKVKPFCRKLAGIPEDVRAGFFYLGGQRNGHIKEIAV